MSEFWNFGTRLRTRFHVPQFTFFVTLAVRQSRELSPFLFSHVTKDLEFALLR
jgi:hypothetical protein